MDRYQARDYINSQEPIFLQAASKKGYICPVCQQGATKGIGLARDRTGHYKCFGGCGLYSNVLGLFAISEGIPDDDNHFTELIDRAAAYYGISIDPPSGTDRKGDSRTMYQNQPKTEQKAPAQNETDFTTLYAEAAAHLQETDYYQRRALSLEVCQRFGAGYIENWKHPKAPATAPGSPRFILPISRYSYLARDTRQTIPADQEDYKKSKVKGRERVSWTFNRKALKTAQRPIFILEGEINALSIIEAGGEALAIGSTAYTDRFIAELDALEEPPRQPLIIALDNDKSGYEAGDKLQAALEERGISCYRANPAGSENDVNDLLIKSRSELQANIAQAEASAIAEAERATAERRDRYAQQNSAAAHLQAFIDGITASVNTPVTPTGFSNLDAALDGGLFEGLYICGAISSLGKTTLITQMADQIAQQGRDVLIFSLEMARAEIMAKSISRNTLQEVLATGGDVRNAKTARGITTGARYARYNQTERELIQTAISRYAEYAQHIFISEGIGDIGVTQIREAVKAHITITGNAPIAIIDYLQILAPYNDRATDKQNTDKAVLELKRISRDYKIPVIAISSFNRENYRNAVTMEAFKESGAVEYSSDVLIGLQLAGAGESGFNALEEKKKDPRAVELVILKNRNGRAGDKIGFQYYPMFNLFRES